MKVHFKKPARYKFILNPYVDARFTYCPKCEGKMGQRKLPLVIHVEPLIPVAINKTCRYCSHCDLLIVHQDEIQDLLQQLFPGRRTPIGKDDYLIIGTLDRADWRNSMKTPIPAAELLDHLYPFKEVLTIEVTGGWVRQGSK
jgi:hypothetical protein